MTLPIPSLKAAFAHREAPHVPRKKHNRFPLISVWSFILKLILYSLFKLIITEKSLEKIQKYHYV
jgi:hypothetical protein